MSNTATIPISISAEAKARLAELGMQSQLERMLEQTCQLDAELRRINVILMPACDPGEGARIILEVTKDNPPEENDPLWRQWRDWMVETFPSEVLRHFNLLTVYGAADEG